MRQSHVFIYLGLCLFAGKLWASEWSASSVFNPPHRPFAEQLDLLDEKLAQATAQNLPTLNIELLKASHFMLYSRFDLLTPQLDKLALEVKDSDAPFVKLVMSVFRGCSNSYKGHYSIAQSYFKQAEGLYKRIAKPTASLQREDRLYLYLRLFQGINLAYLQQYDQAIYELSQVHEIATKHNYHSLQARALYYLGEVSFELKNYEDALVQYEEALQLTPGNDRVYVSELIMSKAQMINIVGERSTAFSLIDQAIEQLQSLGHKNGLAFAYLLKSYFFSKNNQPEDALEWIALSVALREELGVQDDIANAYVHYSDNLAENGQWQPAVEYAKKAADIAAASENLAGQWDAYNNLAQILYHQGDYKQAYEFMSKSERALLGKARLDITSETARLSSEFNLAKEQLENRFLDEQKRILEQKNTLLQTQLSLKELQESRSSNLMLILCMVIVLFLVLSLVIYHLYRKSRYLATRDTLTNLHNRRSILSQGEAAFANSLRYQHKLGVMMLDVDNFKSINDRFGHKFGDRVLKNVARICKDNLRETDLVGRIGGEEFLFILPHVCEQDAIALGQRVRKNIRLKASESLDGLEEVTASIGIALKNEQVKELLELINQADIALYEAKRGGRNRVNLHTQDSLPDSGADAQWEAIYDSQ